jgi:hypothetical protein
MTQTNTSTSSSMPSRSLKSSPLQRQLELIPTSQHRTHHSQQTTHVQDDIRAWSDATLNKRRGRLPTTFREHILNYESAGLLAMNSGIITPTPL